VRIDRVEKKKDGGEESHLSELTPYQKVEMQQKNEKSASSPYSTQVISVIRESEKSSLLTIDIEKANKDIWEDMDDPLQNRHFPTPSEIKRIEEEDVRQAIASGLMAPALSLRTIPLTPLEERVHTLLTRRTMLLGLFVLAILALVLDSVLVSLAFFRDPNVDKVSSNKPPSITVSKSEVHYGENIIVSISNFSSFAQVALTRDIEEPLFNQTSPGLIQVKSDGSANIIVTILNSWGPGFHTIEAEDTATHYTATTSLHIETGSPQPAHLQLSATDIDLGGDIQGANTIEPLTLQNKGSGIISWSAMSDQPWLSLSPNHGILSDTQKILVGATRANLDPGDYTATITISSNVDAPRTIDVQMKVTMLPLNPGAVVSVAPAVLAFDAIDGGDSLTPQAVAVSNPGSAPLYWSIVSNTGGTATSATAVPNTVTSFDPGGNWLNTGISSGVILPGKSSTVYVSANDQNLLPGVYTHAILFETQQNYKALNAPVEVDVTLTVEPRCSLSLDPTDLSFTAVSGQNNPTTQSLNIATVGSCADAISWSASSSANWLSLLSTHGIIHGSANSALTVSVNTVGLNPGLYTDTIIITVPGESSVSVLVNLVVQPPPGFNAPIMSAAPLSLTFSATAGQSDPPGQTVTITNTGRSLLTWSAFINASATLWLSASPNNGKLLPGQTQLLSVKVIAKGLTSGTYAGQITLNGLDSHNNLASGSPQNIAVNFSVLSPCTITPPTSAQIAFADIQGETSPSPQTIVLAATGNCNWPLYWKAVIDNAPPWLSITPATSGSFGSTSQAVTLSIAANVAGIQAGSYQATVEVEITDAAGQDLPNLIQSFSVTLSVMSPCTLEALPASFSFSLQEGYVSNTQSIALHSMGSCAYPLNWTVTYDKKSFPWLNLSSSSGIDTGGGSAVNASVDATQLALGTYNGTLTLTANDMSGATLQNSPVTIPITVTVTGFTLSGKITACTDAACSAPIILAGATVAVTDNASNTVVATTTADASGNYSIANLPAGSYTISATGTDAQGTNYSSVSTVLLAADKLANITASVVSATVPAVATPSP
jgi:hypothetical protein